MPERGSRERREERGERERERENSPLVRRYFSNKTREEPNNKCYRVSQMCERISHEHSLGEGCICPPYPLYPRLRYDAIGRVPAAAFAVGFAVVTVRDASETTERASSASLCKRWSRSASRAATRRFSACCSKLASALRFLRPGSWTAQSLREVGRKSLATVHAKQMYRKDSGVPFLAMPGS